MSRTGWVMAGALLLVVVALGIGLRFAGRFVPDKDLLDELAAAELLDDPLPEAKAWPGWRGPARDGAVSFPGLKRDWTDLVARHKLPGGDGYSSFAIRDGLAWTMGEFGGEEVVLCLDLKKGQEKWRYGYTPSATFQYGGPRSTPAVDGDAVFTVTTDGRLLSLDAEAGTLNWESPLPTRAPRWGHAHSPLVEGDAVYVGPAAYGRTRGEKLWGLSGEDAGYSSPIMATIGGERQMIWFGGWHLIGVSADRKPGAVSWRMRWRTFSDVNAATPQVIRARAGGREWLYIFISSGYGKGSALVKVAKDGDTFVAKQVYESDDLCCHFASPVRRGGYIYALDEARDLSCLDLRTGKVTWRKRGFQKGSLIRVDDLLLILGENGNLALVEASPEEYREVAKTRPFRDRCWATPALAEGRLLIRDRKTIQVIDVGK